MDTLALRQELNRLHQMGFREIRLDLALIRDDRGLPLADTAVLALLPGLLEVCTSTFPDWSIAITRLHPDSIADSISFRKAGADVWCQAYTREAERYLSLLPGKPRHLIAGWHLPLTDTLTCLAHWMQSLHTRAHQVSWLLSPEQLPHPLQKAGTETALRWTLPGDELSKPASRMLARNLTPHIPPNQGLYIASFTPRPGQAEADFRNLFRFWPEELNLSGVTFASVFPVSTLTDSVLPGNLHPEKNLKQAITEYLQQP